MLVNKLINHLQRRRELNQWLKEKRQDRYLANQLSEHIQNDIGLHHQANERPLTWKTVKEERREQASVGKERAGPGSA
ncbi:hypothetical protein BGP77_13395 [Saccharospirillum sp. MSK14-1]|uniref:hypothetical protein n=1 Tax=Saccharospirillum sp. MSK14-1 TaxID=1897632 RepID=UPI000D382AC5|nr:hypothetical protein [Saccharospirillum sp. MSK14-1]PTY37491.1 hypothetical protein BGP77_13395 [Saccharospirillum sp. MSK14-1]